MPMNYPKFDKKIQNQIDISQMRAPKTRPGVIVKYDKYNNTATVVLDDQTSGLAGSVIGSVPCPIINGVQSVAPIIGNRCLIAFRDVNETSPYIIGYFEDNTTNKHFNRNYIANTGIPKYMVR